MTKKEKLNKKIKSIETSSKKTTEKEQYNIIVGRGVDYKLSSGDSVFIKPLTIEEFYLVYEMDDFLNENPNDARGFLTKKLEIFTSLLGYDFINKKDRFDFEDIDHILKIITYVIVKKKTIYKQKFLKKSEIAIII